MKQAIVYIPEKGLTDTYKYFLGRMGYEVTHASSIGDMIRSARAQNYDACVVGIPTNTDAFLDVTAAFAARQAVLEQNADARFLAVTGEIYRLAEAEESGLNVKLSSKVGFTRISREHVHICDIFN